MVLFPPLHVGRPLGIAPEAALEDLSLPLCGPSVEVVQVLGSQVFWQHQVLSRVGGYSPSGRKELDTKDRLTFPLHFLLFKATSVS